MRLRETLKKNDTILKLYEWFIERKESIQYKLYLRFALIQKNKIVFDNFLGKGYGDNPKAIAEEIIRQGLEWDLVWLVRQKYADMPPQIRQVKYASKEAMQELSTARMWVFNCRNVKHPKKKKKQIYLQTWHSSYGFKLTEGQAKDLSESYIISAKADGRICDYILASCNESVATIEKYFWLNKRTKILNFGTPKDDIVFDKEYLDLEKTNIRKFYHISDETMVVLYMPTFRDDGRLDVYRFDYGKIIDEFEKKYNHNVVMLFRLHPNIADKSNLFCDDPRIINASFYPDGFDLFSIADVLISDYSGSIISFAFMKKPIFLYVPDIEDYMNKRGLRNYYFRIPCRKNISCNELISDISQYNYETNMNNWSMLIKEMNYFCQGCSSLAVVNWIKTLLLFPEY